MVFWVVIWSSVISAAISAMLITHALWGVFSNGEWDGKRARCATALRPFYSPLRFKIWPSARPAACREAGTYLCGGSVAQPLRWPPAASWARRKTFLAWALLVEYWPLMASINVANAPGAW